MSMFQEKVYVVAKSKSSYEMFLKRNQDTDRMYVHLTSAAMVYDLGPSVIVFLHQYGQVEENHRVRIAAKKRTDLLLVRDW